MAPTHVRTQIRIPQDLYDRLQEAAEASSRSFNSEMVVRLESSFRHGLETASETDDSTRVQLRAFQRELLEGVRRVVRLEALLGAPKLTSEQKDELKALKTTLGFD